ncbi:hypothetical protein CLOM_g9233 [Closterium sp. NIES-68]|nr:hypothetical protein CLOM_g9233 [Closterium sp. NIES-68]GJP61401.1 hypothetical protein CLOP_g18569 [Closterium sp. NIES-67]GJP62538.1 hypothetical protein CLOP_g19591 [Closterium sp. NIES-67]
MCIGFCTGCCGAFAGTALGHCLCSCCAIAPSRVAAKFLYGGMFLASVVVAWVVRDYATAALYNLYSFQSCAPDNPACVGALAVLRMSFGLCLFFALMLLTTAGAKHEGGCRDLWHSGWWPPKLLLWLLLLFVPFVLPYQVFQVYGEVAIAGAAVFLVIQLVSIINFIYVWNDAWLNNERMHVWMAVVSVVCYLLFLAGIILMYIFFAPASSCSLNIFFITFLLVLVVVLTAISVHPKVDAGPLTTGVMAVYFAFLCWSSIMSEPPSEVCNTRPRQTGYGGWLDIMAFIVALFSIAISVYATGIDSRCFSLRPCSQDEDMAGNGEVPYGYGFFHLVFLTGSMYMAMLLLGWNMNQTPVEWSIDAGWVSTWVKMGLLWVSALVYLWTLVAPFVLRGRDFA